MIRNPRNLSVPEEPPDDDSQENKPHECSRCDGNTCPVCGWDGGELGWGDTEAKDASKYPNINP